MFQTTSIGREIISHANSANRWNRKRNSGKPLGFQFSLTLDAIHVSVSCQVLKKIVNSHINSKHKLMTKYILSPDAGTTSNREILFNLSGEIICVTISAI